MKPKIKVVVEDNGLRISVQLPGLQRDQLVVTAEGRVIRIASTQPGGCGPFSSAMDIPMEYDASLAEAVYVHGELRIRVPKLR